MAAEAIFVWLNIPRNQFSVHCFHLQNYLMVLASRSSAIRPLGQTPVEHVGFKLFIKPLLHQAQATSNLMPVQGNFCVARHP